MKMECLYLLVSMAICLLSVNADSSEEMVQVMYRDGRIANIRAQGTNSISNEDVQTVQYVRPRRRHCTKIKNVCASNNIIYENYCQFKEARLFENIRRVRCTEGHVRAFYAPDNNPAPVTSRPETTVKKNNPKQRVQPEGENGIIDNDVNVIPEPIPTKPIPTVVEIQTTEGCSETCPLTYEPICATDGNDYPNVCVFEASKCTGNTDASVTIAYYGVCEAPSPPTDNLEGFRYCPEGDCEEEINYVCGTDGSTYENKCKLLKVACAANNSSLDIDYEGECIELDVNITTTPEPTPEEVRTMEPLPTPKKSQMTTEDPCENPTCKVVWDPVCADDGKTYPSLCVLENIIQCNNVDLNLLHRGECEEKKCQITCPPLEVAPICGTDGNSYPSKCNLLQYNCDNDVEIEVAYEGECVARGDIDI